MTTHKKSMKQYLADIAALEKEIAKLSGKRDAINERLENLKRKKRALESAHLEAIARYTEGQATDDEVQEAAIKTGSLDSAINGLTGSVRQLDEKIEQAQRKIIGLEKLATEARRLHLYEEAARLADEIGKNIKAEIIKLMMVASAADHPYALPSNVSAWVKKIAVSASNALDREDAPTPKELGVDIPPRIKRSKAAPLELRNKARGLAA